MIQFTFTQAQASVLLFSLLFATASVATGTTNVRPPGGRYVQTQELAIREPTFKPVPGGIYRMYSREWKATQGRKIRRTTSKKFHPVVVLGPDPLTRGWGTIVVEISHSISKAVPSQPLKYYFPDPKTKIPPIKGNPLREGSEIDEYSEINVGQARVVLTVENVFIESEFTLKMEEEHLLNIINSIKRKGKQQSRHSSLFKKNFVFGMGESYSYRDKEYFIPDHIILDREAMGPPDYEKILRPIFEKFCAQQSGLKGQPEESAQSCATPAGEKNNELAVKVPGTVPNSQTGSKGDDVDGSNRGKKAATARRK